MKCLRFILIAAALVTCLPAFVWAQSVQVDFVETPPESVREAVRDAIGETPPPRSPLEGQRQAKRAGDAVRDALNAHGYYDPKIDIAVDAGPPLRPLVRVDTGPAFSIGDVTINYVGGEPRPDDKAKLSAELTVKPGEKAIPAQIIAAEASAAAALRRLGYADAEAGERRIKGNRDTATIDIEYNLTAGRRVKWGEIIYPETIRTKTSYLDRLSPIQSGALYDPADLALYNSRLSETRLFKSSSARLAEAADSETDDGAVVRDVILKLEERPQNTAQFGASFSTSDGYGLTSDLIRRNLTRRGDVLEAKLNVAELVRSLNLEWRRPNELGYGRGLILTTGISDETTDAFDLQSVRFGAGYEIVEGPDFSWTYGASVEALTETNETIERDSQLIGAFVGARIDKADSILDPRRGWRADARLAPTYVLGDNETQYLRAVGQLRGYQPFGPDDRYVIAGRVRLGSSFGAGVDDLPLDRRFYAGGGGSVRGYGYQAIGPRSEEGEPTGGRALLETAIETRWRATRNIGVVAFVDAGGVFTEDAPDGTKNRIGVGAGLGVRYNTPAGPIRLDVAVPLDKTEFDDPVQVYISIGQAF